MEHEPGVRDSTGLELSAHALSPTERTSSNAIHLASRISPALLPRLSNECRRSIECHSESEVSAISLISAARTPTARDFGRLKTFSQPGDEVAAGSGVFEELDAVAGGVVDGDLARFGGAAVEGLRLEGFFAV